MCVGLDIEYTDAVPYIKKMNLPLDQRRRAGSLQLSVAYETLVFQIIHADAGPRVIPFDKC
jgi:hypothetical protein